MFEKTECYNSDLKDDLPYVDQQQFWSIIYFLCACFCADIEKWFLHFFEQYIEGLIKQQVKFHCQRKGKFHSHVQNGHLKKVLSLSGIRQKIKEKLFLQNPGS